QTDLIADARQRREQIFVRCADLAAEELQDALYLAAQQNWKSKRGVKSLTVGGLCPGKVRVTDDVGNPGWLAGAPDPTWQANARAKGDLATGLVEIRKRAGRGAPGIHAAEYLRLAVDSPERPVFPVERLANRLKYFRRRVTKGGRLDE